MDPRNAILRAMNALDEAKMDDKELWKALDNCDGPDDAIAICSYWIEMAKIHATTNA
jgi:hypothetical protein